MHCYKGHPLPSLLVQGPIPFSLVRIHTSSTPFGSFNMTPHTNATTNKLAHYNAWTEAWRTTRPCALPSHECLGYITEEGPQWLREVNGNAPASLEHMQKIVACFKASANARLILLGGVVPPTYDGCNILSENYDARAECTCSGLLPVSSDLDVTALKSCSCKAVERMIEEGENVNSREREWNSSSLFSSKDLVSAMTELALNNADIQSSPHTCSGKHDKPNWPEVKAPDRKPDVDIDLNEQTYSSLYPTSERIRLSADAKHFFAISSGASLVDPGIQMALADSGNDILIADYCDAASKDCLLALQKMGAAAFAFLKLCVYADMMSDSQFNHLVAQTIHFRVIGFYRDHAVSRRPRGVYGSRMTGLDAHRYVDLGSIIGVVCASLATGESMIAGDYRETVKVTALINDLVDFRGDTWRNQRENVVLRGVRGCLCVYLDGLLSDCIGGAATLTRRGKIFALNIMSFCNWMMMSSGHKVYELLRGTRRVGTDTPCRYQSEESGVYKELLQALENYGTLGQGGPDLTMKRRDLQLLYAVHRQRPDTHIKWLADAVRLVLHPTTLRRLVDVVHYQWTGELGDADYCA